MGASVSAQVNQEIYSKEDLLAIDSSHQEVIDQLAVESFSNAQGTRVLPPKASNPSGSIKEAQNSQNYFTADGSYSFSYLTADGTLRSESGKLTPSGYQVRGSWSYLGTDGATYRTQFVADRQGYRPRTFRIPAVGRTGRRKGRKFKRKNSGHRRTKKKGSPRS